MAVAHRRVEELFLPKNKLGAAARRAELDRDQGFALRRAVRPGPREDELAMRHDFTGNTRHFVRLPVSAAEYDPEAPALANIEVGDRDRIVAARPEPALQRL